MDEKLKKLFNPPIVKKTRALEKQMEVALIPSTPFSVKCTKTGRFLVFNHHVYFRYLNLCRYIDR